MTERAPLDPVRDRAAAGELLPLGDERGIAVIAGGVFNSGVLAGGDTFDYRPRCPMSSRGSRDSVRRARATRCRCRRPRCSSRCAHPAVATVLFGCRTPDEVAEDVRLSSLAVPDALWDELA
jgi:D-threo-aldose 1-dehydrogenase